MKDKKIAKEMKECVKICYTLITDYIDKYGEDYFKYPEWLKEEFLDVLDNLEAAKIMYKYHTTQDKWEKVDKFKIDLTFIKFKV